MARSPDRVHEAKVHLMDRIKSAAQNQDLGGLSNAITKCLKEKAIHDVAAMPAFWPSVQRIVGSVNPQQNDAVFLALAEIGRLHSTLKSKAAPLTDIAFELLAYGVPSSFFIGRDGEKRHYAALGWMCSGRPIHVRVAARTAASEETAEKARRSWLEALFSARNVSLGIEHLNAALTELTRSDAESPDSRSRRLQRLLKAVRDVLDPDVFSLDDRAVASLARFAERAFYGLGRPNQYGSAAKAVEELSLLVLHMIRMELQLLTEPAVYDVMRGVSRWLPEGGWLRLTGSSPAIKRLRQTLLQGLVILLKQRNPNEALLDSHRMLSRNSADALSELKATADQHPDIPDDMRSWLSSGGKDSLAKTDDVLTEADDHYIGLALLAARSLARCELLSQEHTEGLVGDLVERSRELESRVTLLAARRKLAAYGTIGGTEKFLPHAHHSTNPDAAPDQVEVLQEGVERHGTVTRVIVPAIVRPLG